MNTFVNAKKQKRNVFNYRELRNRNKNILNSPQLNKYNLKYKALSKNLNSPSGKEHNFFIFLGSKDQKGKKNSKISKQSKGSKVRKKTLNSLLNKKDSALDKRYIKVANLIPSRETPKHLNLKENV